MQNATAQDPLHAQRNIDPEELEMLQRGTGRTSAMLLNLLTQFHQAPQRTYIVVAPTQAHADGMRRMFRYALGPDQSYACNVHFIGESHAWFDKRRMCLREEHCSLGRGRPRELQPVLVVDHAVVHTARVELLAAAREANQRAEALKNWRPDYGN